MDYDRTEALDLSLPRRRQSDNSSPIENTSDWKKSKMNDVKVRCLRRNSDNVTSDVYSQESASSVFSSRASSSGDFKSSSDEMVLYNDDKMVLKSEMKRSSGNVSVCLHDENLWRQFMHLGTEMIINKTGRRMFPHVVLTVHGLDPNSFYSVFMEIIPADNRRYKYVHNQWLPVGTEDPGRVSHPIIHPDSPNSGAFWQRNKISFSKVRLTNNKEWNVQENIDGNILLLSMHKYMVVIKIKNEGLTSNDEMQFVFHESSFFAVTAYQNNQITQLKIQNNPFAKAFREAKCSPSYDSNNTKTRNRGIKRHDLTGTDSKSDAKIMRVTTSEQNTSTPENIIVPQPSMYYPQDLLRGCQMAAVEQIYDAMFRGRHFLTPTCLTDFQWLAMRSAFPYSYFNKDLNSAAHSMSMGTNTMRLPVELSQSPNYYQDSATGKERKTPPSDEEHSHEIK
ncbi:hypothetical protein ACF0H5_008769 [Mactra antiquata]